MVWLRRVLKALELVLGNGDYAAYCRHLQSHHPGERVPTAKEYYLSRLAERYSRPSRCC